MKKEIFNQGLNFLSNELHAKQQQKKIINRAVLVLRGINTEGYKLYGVSGRRSTGRIKNILESNLNTYNYYIDTADNSIIVKGVSKKEEIYYKVYLITLKDTEYCIDDNKLKQKLNEKEPVKISKSKLEKYKRETGVNEKFLYCLPINSGYYIRFENSMTGGNSQLNYYQSIESSSKVYSSITTRMRNTLYLSMYYPEMYNIYTIIHQNGRVLSRENKNKLYTEILKKKDTVTILPSKYKVAELTKEKRKKDIIAKNLNYKEVKEINWKKVFSETKYVDITDKIKKKYVTDDYFEILEKAYSKEDTKKIIEIIFDKLSHYLLSKGIKCTAQEVAVSALGYNYLQYVLEDIATKN